MAKELGLALAQSQEIRNYREAERKMAGEEEACRLTRIFREAHKDLVKSQMEPEQGRRNCGEDGCSGEGGPGHEGQSADCRVLSGRLCF